MPRRPAPNPSLDETPNDGTQTDLAKAAIAVFNPDFDTLNLWGKIARITGMIGGVEKKGYNAFHKYHYVTEADLVSVVRQYLAAAGIVIIPSVVDEVREGDLTRIDVEYTVTDGKEFFTFHMPGYGADKGDKGVYKAITGSNKYALMKLFKIETGDDPEGDTRVDERAAVREAPRPTQVTGGDRAGIRRGGHTATASPVQVRRISELVKELDLERPQFIARIMSILDKAVPLPDEDSEHGKAITTFIQNLSTEEAGKLVQELTTEINDREEVRRQDREGVPGYG